MAKRPKVIAQYRGELSAQQIADGMNAAARNAKRLFDDATILFEAKRFPTSCSLAVLSIEESGKPSLLNAIAAVSDEKTLKAWWNDYRDHQVKNIAWIITELAAKGAQTLDDLAPIYDKGSDHPAILDVIKQLGFYTDCYGNAHWSEPDDVIDENLAKRLLFTAKVLLPKHEYKVREIELWIEYVVHRGPVAMRQAAMSFYKAMEREGLSTFTIEELEAFYGLPPTKSGRH